MPEAILFRRVEKVAREEAFPAYRANIVAYSVSLIAYQYRDALSLSWIWQHQGLSDELTAMIRHVSRAVYERIIDSAEGRNVTEWCKKDECWDAVRSLEASTTDGVPELSGAPRPPVEGLGHVHDSAPAKDSSRSADDVLLVARVMDVAPGTWLELARWGEATGHLTATQVHLATQLRDGAGAGWERTPTIPQAKRAAFILDMAEKLVGPLDAFHFDDADWTASSQD